MVDTNRVKGALDKAKGAVKEGVGELTGDEKLKAEGTADKVKGKAESAVGGANWSEALLARRQWRVAGDHRPPATSSFTMEEFEMGLLDQVIGGLMGGAGGGGSPIQGVLMSLLGGGQSAGMSAGGRSRKPGDRRRRPCRHTLRLPTSRLRTYRTIVGRQWTQPSRFASAIAECFRQRPGAEYGQPVRNGSARLLDAAQSASTKCCKRPHPQWKAAGRRHGICVIFANELVVGCLSSTVLLGNTWRSAFSRVCS